MGLLEQSSRDVRADSQALAWAAAVTINNDTKKIRIYSGSKFLGSRFTVGCLIFILVYGHRFLTLNHEPDNLNSYEDRLIKC